MMPETYAVKPIGVLYGDLTSREHTPKNYEESENKRFVSMEAKYEKYRYYYN